MLVEFHPQHNSQQNDNPYYSLVPWSGDISVEGPSAPAQGVSGDLESVKSHHDCNRIAAADPKHVKAQELKRIEEARAANCCTWKDCPSTFPFLSDADLEHHLEGHAQDVVRRWSGATECPWSGCPSRERFKLLSPLKIHLQNVHVNPLLCVRQNCSFKRPFRNHRDLQRHIETKHAQTGDFRCPYKECETSIVTFRRKDKWLKHVQDVQHQLDNFCPVQHCEKEARRKHFAGFENQKGVMNHMFNEHTGTRLDARDFSCALGSCKYGDPPYLTKDQLARHLVEDHSLKEKKSQDIVDAVEDSGSHQLNMQLLRNWKPSFDCRLCAPPSPPARRRRGRRVVYCCQCKTPHNATVNLCCTGCPEKPHEFCSNCTWERALSNDEV
ncbi:hypothetical protein L207DRAFT_195416 [Hyaloscypha variabilis F]|uniref:C2H2-type domain-containing protein n=1 Tax=Hyaloscypha variabilis (strain UAMH 11265 / GT02V1 / F) TaxID=1149755 RepID=A0A2J6QYN9_HYAVF|nr:hypothetical protein L207DRAFT_195416 [Hyaloscypha variabilis F]